MRESLIQLLKKWCTDNTDGFPVEAVADAILKENWVKFPCDLGGGGIRSRSAVRRLSGI